MTNGDMVLRLIQVHMAEFLEAYAAWDMGLPYGFCDGRRCGESGDVPIESCRLCAREWLEKPYDGAFTMIEGRFVVQEAGHER